MLSQNLVQVYANDDGDAVLVIGRFESVGNPVQLESIVIPFEDLESVGAALKRVYNQIDIDCDI